MTEIVHVDFSPVWRGGQQQLWLLASELRRGGWAQTIVAPEGETARRFAGEGFRVIAPGGEARRIARAAGIVHAHDGHAHSWMLRVAFRCPVRTVLSRRVAFPIRSPVSRWKYRRLDLVIAVSHYVAAQVLATGLPAARVAVIPDGIALAALPDPDAARSEVRARCGLGNDVPCLVCLGALTAEKGVGDAIAAMASLPGACHLWLTGAGPLQPALLRQAEALACAARVHFVSTSGFTAAQWVAAADLLLMPSRGEGFGSAALLAMALGKPVVACRTGGIPELIEHEITGLLAPVASPLALAAAARRLLEDAALSARVSAMAHARVEQRYTAAGMADATLAAYAHSS
ncbi:MAG: glycosyltransferase family 4 protein [Terriglobales bacterium]